LPVKGINHPRRRPDRDVDHHEPMAATINPATRTTVTERITAHVREGWPHLGDPIVSFRGQFCYVALPGRTRARWQLWRQPTPPSPVLRLRYQGHIDSWKIAIYKYSTETYTEAELPTSFGPVTGTPEEGVNHTFPLYGRPQTPSLTSADHTESPLRVHGMRRAVSLRASVCACTCTEPTMGRKRRPRWPVGWWPLCQGHGRRAERPNASGAALGLGYLVAPEVNPL
jgi:hypothetical protein